MGFSLKSTKKLLGRLGSGKNRSRKKREDEHSDNSAMTMMADHNKNNGNDPQPIKNKSRPSCMRSSSAKRLLSSFTISRRGPGDNARQITRRASIETAKVSSLDFQSSRILYHNDSDMEDVSHSSFSEGNMSSSALLHSSQRLSIYSSPPPVQIVEGNSSEEFSSGSIRARHGCISVQPQSQRDTCSVDRALAPMEDDAGETKRISDVSTKQDEKTISVIVEDRVIPLMEPVKDDDDDDDANCNEPSSPANLSSYDRPKRASASSGVSNLSDDYEEDEEEDQLGVYMGGGGANDVDFHLEFVPSDLRADYLLVYKFLQEEAHLASIQDDQWRRQVRSARLRANTRQHLSQIKER
jgi:hypothetical protein